MSNKIKIIIGFAIAVLIIVSYFFIGKGENYEFVELKRGDLSLQISETGQIQKDDKLGLSFKNGGRIDRIFIEEDEEVTKGDKIAELNYNDLLIQKKDAEASLDLANAKLSKLILGATKEEISFVESQVRSREVDVENKEQGLEDTILSSDESLLHQYEDASIYLDDAYLKAINAYYEVSRIQEEYFTYSGVEGVEVQESKAVVYEESQEIKEEALNIDLQNGDLVELAIDNVIASLNNVYFHLSRVRSNCEKSLYKKTVIDTDKTSLDNQKSYVISVRDSLIDKRQGVSSIKTSNQVNINNAKFSLSSAKSQLDEANRNLEKLIAPPGEEDVKLNEAEVKKAEASLLLINSKINDSILYAPKDGVISEIVKNEGETVNVNEVLITFIPKSSFEIQVDIYEEDIIMLEEGYSVQIDLVAYPDQTIMGYVSNIGETEKIKDGVVYYEVSIDLENAPEGLKHGMTADITIEVEKRENVIILPQNVVERINGKGTIRVIRDGVEREIEIKLGLEADGMVEIISGIREDEKVIK